ncbi:polyhydroxyalkanoate depolymerase [Flavisphingomonas formosensis]|uniref:polyhydroxyalkanoate depolymerase n=1 Tax=Flavisphingomonas formosensis TaxID=861534 RepID=UPI0012F7B58A|nr:polyhydroxyalkanoate depolymerase [Sphingomonas formosensis]
MLYAAFQALTDAGKPIRAFAEAARGLQPSLGGFGQWPVSKSVFAALSMVADTKLTHHRPSFGIDAVPVGNRLVPVGEETVLALPFGDLLHFTKEVETPQPKILLVTPLSGHFSTLLRDTVATLLRDHDVYVADWRNARDIPLSEGRFGFDDYVDYVIRFLEEIGPGAHVMAVCQPCVQTLAAVSIMAEDKNPATPRSMTLMGGPVDTRVNPTTVNELAVSHSLDWFKKNMIQTVPIQHAGWRRKVYPGFLQLTAFMSMNLGRHMEKHRELYQDLADGRDVEAANTRAFYDEYFAVLDLTAEFYIETVDIVFQRALLAKGELEWRGRRVNPGAIRRTALLTVEGERDDICAVGQTSAAHDLCSHLRPHLKRHHLQPGVGHYGVFSGRKWENQIYPVVRNLVLSVN